MKDNLQKVKETSSINPAPKDSVPPKKKAVKKGLSLENKMVFGLVGTVIVFLSVSYITYQNLSKSNDSKKSLSESKLLFD